MILNLRIDLNRRGLTDELTGAAPDIEGTLRNWLRGLRSNDLLGSVHFYEFFLVFKYPKREETSLSVIAKR